MADPVSLILAGAAGGLGGQVAKDAWSAGKGWVARYLRGYAPAAQETAQQNVAQFLIGLANRVNRLEERVGKTAGAVERFEKALKDPDFAASLKSALLGAARTGSREKHETIARGIIERLTSVPESTEALASTLAIEAIPRLSSSQLNLLRVAALINAIRPAGLPLPDEPPDGLGDYETTAAEMEALTEYPEWVVANLSPLSPDEFKTSDYTHLVSSGCLIFERRPWLDIEDVLTAQGKRQLTLASSRNYVGRLQELLWDTPGGTVLQRVWENGLRDMILTPAGLLIGTAAHDVRNGAETPVNWAMSKSALAGPPGVTSYGMGATSARSSWIG